MKKMCEFCLPLKDVVTKLAKVIRKTKTYFVVVKPIILQLTLMNINNFIYNYLLIEHRINSRQQKI